MKRLAEDSENLVGYDRATGWSRRGLFKFSKYNNDESRCNRGIRHRSDGRAYLVAATMMVH